jgi:hypothetical protein
MAEYLHPHVSSNIIDNSATFVSSEGTNKLLVAFTSDKGRDNKLELITSPSEFIFNYGEPNWTKHGQAAYNALEWLQSGGDIYGLRVMPENSGYSNIIFNVQTKVESKSVKDSNGDLVTVDDVNVRPLVGYTSVNNTSEEALQNELTRTLPNTLDGYTNNQLFAIYPIGRGEYYNDMGIRLSRNESYDSTYDFKLYDFEVIQETDSGSVQVVEGPFVVSFSPDAVDVSGQSMFIESVIARNSDYYRVMFNEDNFDGVGEIINPEVHPQRLDLLTFQESDSGDTFNSSETGATESIYMYVTQYDDAGEPTSRLNIPEMTNTIEQGIVDIDNTIRKEIYEQTKDKIDSMKSALSDIINDTYDLTTYETEISTLQDDALTVLDDIQAKIEEYDQSVVDGSPIDLVLEDGDGVSLLALLKSEVSELTDKVRELVNYAQAGVGTTPELLALQVALENVVYKSEALDLASIKELYNNDILGDIDLNSLPTDISMMDEYLSELEDIALDFSDVLDFVREENEEVTSHTAHEVVFDSAMPIATVDTVTVTLLADNVGSEEVYTVTGVSDVSNLVDQLATELRNPTVGTTDYLVEVNDANDGFTVAEAREFEVVSVTSDNVDFTEADDVTVTNNVDWERSVEILDLTALENRYSSFLSALDTASDELLPMDGAGGRKESYEELKNTLVSELLSDLESAVDNVMVEHEVEGSLDLMDQVDTVVSEANTVIAVVDSGSATVENSKTYISEAENDVTKARQNTYRMRLDSFDNSLFLNGGKDGDLSTEDSALKTQTTKDLLIKAYTGMIDPDLTNEKLFPIDLVIDANYDKNVKDAIVDLVSQIRRDFPAILDTGFTANVEQAIDYRENKLMTDTFFASIFTQDVTVYDEYTGRDIRVTSPYFLAGKIPTHDDSFGVQYPFVGPKRGGISGYESISWIPNTTEKERLYKRQVNYIEKDTVQTRFNSQLTAQTFNSALSNINNVRVLLKMQRTAKAIADKYQFEFFEELIPALQSELNDNLSKWVANGACRTVTPTVYASEYDRNQKKAKVKIEVQFSRLAERFVINFVVDK